MRAYFRYIKRLQPKLSPEANAVLSRFYQKQRNMQGRDQSRTTIRLLESLVRLSQGHARLMLRSRVTAQDAVVAVLLWEAAMAEPSMMAPPVRGLFDPPSMLSSSLEQHHGSPLHASFPTDPLQHYVKQATDLLQRLQLPDVLAGELSRVGDQSKLLAATRLAAICSDRSPGLTAPAQERATVPATASVPGGGAEQETGVMGPRGALMRGPSLSSCLLAATQDIRRRDVIEELEDKQEDAHHKKQTQAKTARRKGGPRSGSRKKRKQTAEKRKTNKSSHDAGIDRFLKILPNTKDISNKNNPMSSESEDGEHSTCSSGEDSAESDLHQSVEDALSTSSSSSRSDQHQNDSSTVGCKNNKRTKRKLPDSPFCINSLIKKKRNKNDNEQDVRKKPSEVSGSSESKLQRFVKENLMSSLKNLPILSTDCDGSEGQTDNRNHSLSGSSDNDLINNNKPGENVASATLLPEDDTIGLTQKAKKILKKYACSDKNPLKHKLSGTKTEVHQKPVTKSVSRSLTKPSEINLEKQTNLGIATLKNNSKEPLHSSGNIVSNSDDSPYNRQTNHMSQSVAPSSYIKGSAPIKYLPHSNPDKCSTAERNPPVSNEGSLALCTSTNTDTVTEFTKAASKLKRFSYQSKSPPKEEVVAGASVPAPSSEAPAAQTDGVTTAAAVDGVTTAAAVDGGLATAKRSCFQLTSADPRGDKSTQFLWAKKQSTEKSFGKFASSQELDDEDFDF